MIDKPKNWVYLAILLAIILHGALLPFTYGQTYDAYIHMFFGNHYFESWFDPWETKWYTGFTVTAYPPGSHQLIGLLLNFVDMQTAFILVMVLAVTLLVIGVYRFSRVWVSDKAAAFATILAAFASGISETIHVFGQLPTILSIGLFLNALPHMAGWIERGKKTDLALALIFTAGATSVHHVTPLFGTVFFVAPIGVAAWISNLKRNPLQTDAYTTLMKKTLRLSIAPARGVVLGLMMLVLLVSIVFPYWHWSITDPITQVNIGHGSRENFIKKPNLGLMFFVIPWGLLIGVLPYVILKLKSPLWPLCVSVIVAFILGTGGTTPIPKMVLGPAFGILTLDRFTFWGTLLILPFAGLLIQSMVSGRFRIYIDAAFGKVAGRVGLVSLMVCYGVLPLLIAAMPTVRPMQPEFVEPAPMVKFMEEDNHSRWRYLTLGFGDQFAYHSALIKAESVDGNYHSARRLPALTNYNVERLENSKFAGVPGLASLNQFLTNADKFHLKFIFSNDEYYDPLLHYTGWNKVTRLGNGIMVWEKQNISPLPDIRARRTMPRYQVLMWGIVPISALALVGITLIILTVTGQLISAKRQGFVSGDIKPPNVPLESFALLWVRIVPIVLGGLVLFLSTRALVSHAAPERPEQVIRDYYLHLSFREMSAAYALLIPKENFTYDNFLREQRLTGGLVPSYGSLKSAQTVTSKLDANTVSTQTVLTYLTSIGLKQVDIEHRLVRDASGQWKMNHIPKVSEFSEHIVMRTTNVQTNDLTGRNIIEPNSEAAAMLQRPDVNVSESYLIQKNGRLYVTGHLLNMSNFPACVKVSAEAIGEEGEIFMTQSSGVLGPHRLLPGESSPFVIRFEGFMKIGDASFDTAHDPTLFSLPEFTKKPKGANLNIETTVCSADVYKDIEMSDPSVTDGIISLRLTNNGRLPVSTLQLKLSMSQNEMAGLWIEPSYLQFNLRPGETREVSFAAPLSDFEMQDTIAEAKINGQMRRASNIQSQGLPVIGSDYVVHVDYDAMIYQQKE